DLAQGRFQRVLGEAHEGDAPITRVLLCTGKIYYDLLARRYQLKRYDVAIVRLEQLYPWPREELRAALAPYADGTRVVWVQEEPGNQGAWPYVERRFRGALFDRLPLEGIAERRKG